MLILQCIIVQVSPKITHHKHYMFQIQFILECNYKMFWMRFQFTLKHKCKRSFKLQRVLKTTPFQYHGAHVQFFKIC